MTEKCSLSLCSTASAHKQMTPWLPVESLGAGGRENAPIEHLKTRCKMPLLENLCLLRSTFTLAPPSNDTVGAAPAFWIRRGQLAEESEEKDPIASWHWSFWGLEGGGGGEGGSGCKVGQGPQQQQQQSSAWPAWLPSPYINIWDIGTTLFPEKKQEEKKWRHSICKAGLFHTAGKTFSKGS